MNFDAEADREKSQSRMPTRFVLPVVTAALALAVGLVAGGVAGWLARPPIVETQLVPRELTDAELEALWAPKVAAVEEDLTQARDRVAILEDEVKSKEAKVQELESEMARRAAKGQDLRRQLDEARAELATVKQQLADAIAEKEALATELKVTVAKLDEQKQATKVAKEETMEERWHGFVRQSQLDVCEKGTRKRLGNCRETITSVMNADMQQRFVHCLRAGQEAPTLHEAAKDEEIPQFAQYLDQEDRITRDWYVLLCDPTLPEAARFAELSPTPSATPAPSAEAAASAEPGDQPGS